MLNIPDDDGKVYKLLEKHGLLSIASCKAHASTYVSLPFRTAQNSVPLFMFLGESLMDDAKNTILNKLSDHTVNGQPSGPCLLKVIIGKSIVEKIATVNALQQSIANLSHKVTDLNSSV